MSDDYMTERAQRLAWEALADAARAISAAADKVALSVDLTCGEWSRAARAVAYAALLAQNEIETRSGPV
jgi:hypothetical protein